MAETSWPTAGHNDRAVTDTEYELLVGQYAGEGVIGNPGQATTIYAAGGLEVGVRANMTVLLRGHAWLSGALAYTLPVPANTSGTDRWDLVVVGLDRATWNMSCYIKPGAGGGTAGLQRDQGSTGKWEVPLARILNRTGATSIADADVQSLEYYVAPLPTVVNEGLRDWIPQDLGNEIIDQRGRHWVKQDGAWRPLLANDYAPPFGMRMVGSWYPWTGADIYWSGNGTGSFASFWFNAVAGHLYQASLDVKIRTGENVIDEPLEAVIRMTVGGQTVCDSGTQKIIKKRESKRLHFSAPVYGLGAGGQQAYVTAFKSYGDGQFTIPGHDFWFRVYDLGPQ